MSDACLSESDEDARDFSASEDEWLPVQSDGKGYHTRKESAQNSSDSDADSEFHSNDECFRNKATRKISFRKGSTKITNQTGEAALKRPHEDSDSSGDEYLVDPTRLDLNSKFFDAVPSFSAGLDDGCPNFDCNAGIGKLSDSSEDETEPIATQKCQARDASGNKTNKRQKNLISKSNEMSQAYVNFQDFSETLEKAKVHLQTVTNQQQLNLTDSTLDVSHLLALGEAQSNLPGKKDVSVGKPSTSSKSRKAAKGAPESDSDWEEVGEGAPPIDKKTVQITLRPEAAAKKNKKCTDVDVEACIKRMINRDKRDAQLVLHKMTIIMGIAHGNYTNTILNDPSLLAIGNGLIPSERCYPKGRTNLGYFEQIMKYFREIVDLKDTRMFVRSWKRLELEKSLRLQLLSQMANSRRDYILLFIILLRSIGIQCRMVISLQVVPKNVPTADLLKVIPSNVKKAHDSTTDVKRGHEYGEDKKPISSGKRKATSFADIPQLDGVDDAKRIKRSKKAHVTGGDGSRRTKRNQNLCDGEEQVTNQADASFSPRKTRKQRLDEANKRKTPSEKKVIPNKGTLLKDSKQVAKGTSSATEKDSMGCKPGTSKMLRGNYHQIREENDLTRLENSNTMYNPLIGSSTGKKIVKIERFSSKTKRALDRRVLSTDDEAKQTTNGLVSGCRGSNAVNLWIEVYAEEEERWFSIDVTRGMIQCVDQIVNQASSPMLYVLAWNNDASIKDVSARYCAQYVTITQKLRIMQQWMDNTLLQFRGERTTKDIVEDRELNRILEERPLPKTIAEYKCHPYFALKRHLLKFEAIYPPDAPTLGFTSNKEPVYARECVHTLHAREVWLKQARTVKLYETAYKIVSARPKYNRATGQIEPAEKPLELFGHWQTEDYEPPTAENGIVPRNAYGNVELFKPCMLPKKTVHLRLPCLNRICKKLRIDCAQAVTGFDFHGGSSHPVYDGFVVCEEYRGLVVDAWHQEQEAEEQRARDKYEKRVYGNWKRLIKGLLIRRKLQHKYNFDNMRQ